MPIVAQTTSDIVDKILALPPKTRVMLLAPVVRGQKGEFRDVIERLAARRLRPRPRGRRDGRTGQPNVRVKLDAKQAHTIEAVVDRLVMDDKVRVRLQDSVETALRWGEGVMLTLHQAAGARRQSSCRSQHRAKRSQTPNALTQSARSPSTRNACRTGSKPCTPTACIPRPPARATSR